MLYHNFFRQETLFNVFIDTLFLEYFSQNVESVFLFRSLQQHGIFAILFFSCKKQNDMFVPFSPTILHNGRIFILSLNYGYYYAVWEIKFAGKVVLAVIKFISGLEDFWIQIFTKHYKMSNENL